MAEKHSQKRKGKRVKQERNIVNPSATDDIDVLFETFINAKVTEGRATPTLTKYRNVYDTFGKFMDVNGVERNIQNVNIELIRQYITWLLYDYVKFKNHKYKPEASKEVGLPPKTVQDYLKNMRAVFRFLIREKLIASNPFEHVGNVKFTENDITILSVNELKALLNAPDKRNYVGFRDYVVMTLLIDSMARINEALHFKISDVDFSNNTIRVRASVAKNRKSRTIPLQKRTIRLLTELMEEVEEFGSEYIFLSNYGEVLEQNHFRSQLKKQYAEKAGIEKNVHPHLFRHTAATMFLEAGGDIRHLQLILGHFDLRMVMKYTHIFDTSLQKQHRQFSPINQVVGKLGQERKTKRK